jgi:hypothetical protein
MKVKGLTINESEFPLENGKWGKIAVFLYSGPRDPRPILDGAVEEYTKLKDGIDNPSWEFIAASLDNPWMRIVLSNLNDMKQEEFDSDLHNVNIPSKWILRQEKIDNLLYEKEN